MPQPIRIPFEAETSEAQKRVDALTARMDAFKEKTGELKGDLQEYNKSSAGTVNSLAQQVKGFLATGAAVLVLQQGYVLAKETLEDYLKAAEKTPELFSTDQLANARELGSAVDDLGDSFTKLKISAIDSVAPGLSKVASGLSETIDKTVSYDIALDKMADGQEKVRLTQLFAISGQREYNNELILGIQASDGFMGATLELSSAVAASAGRVESMDRAMLVYAEDATTVHGVNIDLARSFAETEKGMLTSLSAGIKLTDMTEKYNDNLESLNEKLVKENEELLQLEKRYGAGSKKVDEQREKIKQLEQAVVDLGDANQNQTDKWIANLLAQAGASAEFQTIFAESVGLVTENSTEMVEALFAIEEALAENKITAMEAAQMINRVRNGLLKLDGASATVDVWVIQHGSIPRTGGGAVGGFTTQAAKPGGGNRPKFGPSAGFASGVSDFMVPPGFQNDTFPIRVSSGERVNVETKGQQAQGGGFDMAELAERMDDAIRGIGKQVSVALQKA